MMITVAMKPITISSTYLEKGRNGPWQAIAERLLKVCKESVNENQGRRRVIPARD